MTKIIRQYVKEIFSLDLRSLALFRVCLGLFMLIDLWIRGQALEAFYTDFGVIPRGPYLTEFTNRFHISFHFMTGTYWGQIVLFSLNALVVMLFLVGWRTRLTTFLSWAFLISLQSRAPIILQGGDILLRMLMFWSLFLPLGAAWSVDAALDTSDSRQKKNLGTTILSVGSFALVCQLLIFYWFSVVNKSGDEWWKDFSAVYYALHVDHFATPVAQFIRTHLPFSFLQFLTILTLIIETIGVGVILITPISSMWRISVVLMIIGMHAGFRSCLNVSIFPFISSIFMLAFLPTPLWDKIYSKLKSRQAKLKIYFDGECRFCKKLLYLVKTFLVLNCEINEAQSSAEHYRLMVEKNSWIIEESSGQKHFAFAALTVAFQESLFLSFLAPLMRITLISRIGSWAYAWVASNRVKAASWVRWMRWGENPVALGPLRSTFAALALLYVFCWNAGDVNWPIYIPRSLYFIGPTLRIDQIWDMFSPYPMRNDGWYVIPAKLKNGAEVDLIKNGGPVSFERPNRFGHLYPTHHWEKYVRNVLNKKNAGYLLYWGKYLCRTWNRDHQGDEQLSTFQIIFMEDVVRANYQRGPIEKVVLWNHDCWK